MYMSPEAFLGSIAFIDPESAAVIVPVIIFMIPIIAILTAHQRKMAEIIHRKPQVNSNEMDVLHREIGELKQLVHQQAIALDDMRSRQLGQSSLPDIRDRMSNNS